MEANAYQEELWGWSMRMKFPAVKIVDYADRTAELEPDSNPFAQVVLAHLKALETRRDPHGRRAWKFRLVRGLYEHGFKAEDVRKLFRLIDWLMELPPKLDKLFWNEVHQYEEKQTMPFITTPERIARKEAMLVLIESLLQAKFGEEGAKLMPEIADLEDMDKYNAMNIAIGKATKLEDVRRACTAAAVPREPTKKNSRRKRG
jgi:hypothetical protein